MTLNAKIKIMTTKTMKRWSRPRWSRWWQQRPQKRRHWHKDQDTNNDNQTEMVLLDNYRLHPPNLCQTSTHVSSILHDPTLSAGQNSLHYITILEEFTIRKNIGRARTRSMESAFSGIKESQYNDSLSCVYSVKANLDTSIQSKRKTRSLLKGCQCTAKIKTRW